MKTRELKGAMLDYWVSRVDPRCSGLTPEKREDHIVLLGDIEGKPEVCAFIYSGGFMSAFRLGARYKVEHYRPSSNWAQGGLLIAEYRIGFGIYEPGERAYFACIGLNDIAGDAHGPDHLTAACRAIVASKFGDEVEDFGAAPAHPGEEGKGD